MGQLKHKGGAIDVVAPAGATITKGELYGLKGWNGIAMANVLPTDPELGFALEVGPAIWFIQAPSGLVANEGDKLYWAGSPTLTGIWQGPYDLVVSGTGGALTSPACKVEQAIDGNYIVGVRALNV